MKTLGEILKKLDILYIKGSVDFPISNISFDSRKVENNHVFVAVSGTQTNGHNFIEAAIKKGAKAIVCEVLPSEMLETVTYLKVKNAAEALGFMAADFYDNPSEEITLIGVTGTNGKTTTVTLLYRLFKKLGYKVGLISTIANYIDDIKNNTTHTTPEPLTLNRLLREMVEAGCEYAFMEVSSHSTVQHRVTGITYAGGVFTNLTHDHLDFHGTFAEYLKAKKLFFDTLPKNAFALTNIDDRNGEVMLQNTLAKKYTYALKTPANFKAKILEQHFEGTLIEINDNELWVRLIGTFNIYNLTVVFAVAYLLGVQKEDILLVLSNLTTVSGRFDTVRAKNGVTAIVDYAHTPDALENVLTTINELKTPDNTIITVVGAGGDRDKTKRPIMAKIAHKFSNKVILTSDNPRTEKPEDILNDMKKGLSDSELANIITIQDRKEAIKTAAILAKANDIILIAGKGHETYQEVNGVRTHFDDKELITNCFELIM